MIKNLKTTIVLLMFGFIGHSQILDPVSWEVSAKKIDVSTYDIQLKAIVESPWHIYSQYTEKGGPFPTELKIIPNSKVQLKGKPKELGKLVEKYEEVFMVDTRYFDGDVTFVQRVTTSKKPITLNGSVTYMACKDEQCLAPQEEEFEITLN